MCNCPNPSLSLPPSLPPSLSPSLSLPLSLPPSLSLCVSMKEVRRKVSPLLKAFQAEIDALSRRSQAAEAAYLSSYRKTIEIPGTLPLLVCGWWGVCPHVCPLPIPRPHSGSGTGRGGPAAAAVGAGSRTAELQVEGDAGRVQDRVCSGQEPR